MAHHFITQFHEIKGESVGERQRNLNRILKNLSITKEEKQFILDNLSPKTYLENLFYVDVLIHFRETNRLLEIFKEGYGVFVSKIMKQPWFFQEAFHNIPPKSLVDDFLPLLSFSTKIKLLRNLSHVYTEENIDEIFDYVVNRYGLFMTDPLITICSSDKIAAVIKNYKIKLSTHQLKIMYRKDPNLIDIYFNEQKQYSEKNVFDNNFMTYLAERNPVYFWELIDKFKIDENLKLGRRITKKLISTKTQEIVNDPEKYLQHLRHETLVRKLNKQGHFKQFYYNLFPRRIEEVETGKALCSSLLKYYPKSAQYNLFANTFNDVMKEDLWHYTSCMRDNLLGSITNIEVRESWAETRYKESGNEEYLKFYEITKAIKLIKEKINATSAIKKRSKLVSLLAKSCSLNKNLKYLEEVLKYFCIRHKNDDKSVRAKFLQIVGSNFDFQKFTAIHWKYIIEILTVQNAKREYGMFNEKLRIEHINYLYKNNGSEEENMYFILEYIKEQAEYSCLSFYVLNDIKNPEIQRIILLEAMKYVDAFIKKHHSEHDNHSYLKSQIIVKLFWFNITYPKYSINIEENKMVTENIKIILEGDQYIPYKFQKYVSKIICKLNRSDFENELLDIFLRRKPVRQFGDKVIRWYLKYDPMVIKKHFESVVEGLPPNSYYIWTRIKLHTHLFLDENIIKHCIHLLKDGDNIQTGQMLSVLQNSESYIKTMEDFNLIPTSSKVDVSDPETRRVYQVQNMFLRNFKNVWNPLNYVSLLIDKFCQGDYLRESLTSLYTAFYNIPENKLEVYIDKLRDNKAISVKKHGLSLARFMFPQYKVLEIFNNFQLDKNESLQTFICLSSLRYFTKVQTQEYFEKTLSYMKLLRDHDTESLEILSSAQIPKNYKPFYIINMWNLLEKLKTNPNAIGFNKLMSTVLGNIDKKCLSNLPEDFCKTIINNYFGTVDKEEEIDNIFVFTINFLMYHKNQTDNLKYVFKTLSGFKSEFWISNEKERSVIDTFFNAFLTVASEKDADLQFVLKFSTEWETLFTPSESFKEHVLLNLLRFKKDGGDNTELYSKHIVMFAEEVKDKYGDFVFSKFIRIVAKFCILGNKEKETIELLTTMLKYKTSPLNCILVMELITMKHDLFYKNKVRPTYREINSILKQIADPEVQLCYFLYSKNEYI